MNSLASNAFTIQLQKVVALSKWQLSRKFWTRNSFLVSEQLKIALYQTKTSSMLMTPFILMLWLRRSRLEFQLLITNHGTQILNFTLSFMIQKNPMSHFMVKILLVKLQYWMKISQEPLVSLQQKSKLWTIKKKLRLKLRELMEVMVLLHAKFTPSLLPRTHPQLVLKNSKILFLKMIL